MAERGTDLATRAGVPQPRRTVISPSQNPGIVLAERPSPDPTFLAKRANLDACAGVPQQRRII